MPPLIRQIVPMIRWLWKSLAGPWSESDACRRL